ncbi:MAG: Dabb family protein [Opitutae bacterium]|nr:Dabb family protein [Opitutae bacterium]
MFIHTVYFWLRKDLTEEERRVFMAKGVDSLKNIPSTTAVYTGVPADTNRPVIDRSYDYSLTVVLENRTAHDEYQEDPIHHEFVNRFADYWIKVQIYDAVG